MQNHPSPLLPPEFDSRQELNQTFMQCLAASSGLLSAWTLSCLFGAFKYYGGFAMAAALLTTCPT